MKTLGHYKSQNPVPFLHRDVVTGMCKHTSHLFFIIPVIFLIVSIGIFGGNYDDEMTFDGYDLDWAFYLGKYCNYKQKRSLFGWNIRWVHELVKGERVDQCMGV